jgi:hypothetical protein
MFGLLQLLTALSPYRLRLFTAEEVFQTFLSESLKFTMFGARTLGRTQLVSNRPDLHVTTGHAERNITSFATHQALIDLTYITSFLMSVLLPRKSNH